MLPQRRLRVRLRTCCAVLGECANRASGFRRQPKVPSTLTGSHGAGATRTPGNTQIHTQNANTPGETWKYRDSFPDRGGVQSALTAEHFGDRGILDPGGLCHLGLANALRGRPDTWRPRPGVGRLPCRSSAPLPLIFLHQPPDGEATDRVRLGGLDPRPTCGRLRSYNMRSICVPPA